MVLESTAEDNVHWKLVETTTMTFDSIDITLTNSFLNKIAGWFKGSINKVVQSFLPEVTKLLDDEITLINNMVSGETEYTWDFGLLSKQYPLNMTMTTAPSLAKDSHLIKFNIDGTFHKEGGHLKPYSHEYFPSIEGTHREQLWIHQTTLNTLAASAASSFFPYKMNSPELKKNLLLVLPELKTVCGDAC